MPAPVAVDLFSGCGGLTLGLKWAGFRVIGAVDIDPLSNETYEANHPEVRLWKQDIRTLEVQEVKEALGLQEGELDLLAGCPPCQGFSTLRTMNRGRAAEDPRNDLIFEFLRFVRGLKPKAIMMENVPGLARDARMAAFLETIKELGYEGEPHILNAADYGVPQRRRRMLLLSSRLGPIEPAPSAPFRQTVRDAIGAMPPAGHSGDPLHDFPESRNARILDIIKMIPKNGGGRTGLGKDCQLACHRRLDGFKDVYGRMHWDKPAPTVTSGCVNPSKGRFLHPELDRAITLREASLLQGFPPDYQFSLRRGKFAIAALIGNALPPEFIAAHAKIICRVLRETQR